MSKRIGFPSAVRASSPMSDAASLERPIGMRVSIVVIR